MLARREHAEAELLRKLTAKGFETLEVQPVLTALIQENLLSPTRFVENYISFRSSKGFGPLHIQAELKDRGIPEELIEHHLKITDNTWIAIARETWQKRFKNRLPEDFKTRAQHMRFLVQRGFTREQINSIFKSSED